MIRTPRLGVGGVLPPGEIDLAGQIRDAQHILVSLGGQAQHEVELHAAPPAGESGAAGLEQVLLPQVLVDGVPQPLGPRLRREGEASLPHPLEPLHQIHGEGVRPQGGQ